MTAEPLKKNMGTENPDRHGMVDYYVIDGTNTKKRQTPIKKRKRNRVLYYYYGAVL
jgi:hypothetical protein